MDITNSITFYGELDSSYQAWDKWIQDLTNFAKEQGIEFNYYAIITDSGKSGNVRPIKGINRRLNNIKKKGEKIKGITLQVLQDDFEYAVVDYKVTASRHRDYATYITNLDFYPAPEVKILGKILKENMQVDYGEIYEMDIREYPEVYALRVNDKKEFKTLRVLERLD